MKLRLLATMTLIALAGPVSAATIILNPGESNIYGQPLNCTIAADPYNPYPTPVVTPTPPPPPPMVLRPVGEFRSTPNMACINNITSDGNNGHLGKAAENCGLETVGPTSCDSTRIFKSETDQACYNSVAAKANGPLNSGQQHAIEKGCARIQGECLVYRPQRPY